jgi:hypothetical protein
MSRLPNTTPVASNVVNADVDDDEVYGVDFTDKLPSGITVSSVSTEQANDASADPLTIGTITVNASEFEGYNGQTVAIGKGCTFAISPPTTAATYRIKFKALCSDTKTRSVTGIFNVTEGLTFPS